MAHWEPGTYVVDSYALPIPWTLTPCKAELWIGVGYEKQRAPITEAAGHEERRDRAKLMDFRIIQ